MPTFRHGSDTEVAYLAGILDGEGCLTIESNKGHHRPLVHVTNTDLALLGWIEERFGGSLNSQPVGKASERAKDCYRLTWTGNTARALLDLVLPYLVVKRPQADVLLRFGPGQQGKRLTADVREIRSGLVSEIRVLNRKGKVG